MSTTVLNKKIIENSFREMLNSLSEKEKIILSRRVWLDWEKQTLNAIGQSFTPTITRERVRQIENVWIKKIERLIKSSSLSLIQEKAKEFIALHWWIIAKDKLLNLLIKELKLTPDVNNNILDAIISADIDIEKSKPKLWVKTHFYFKDISKKLIEEIHKEWVKILKKRRDVMKKQNLYEKIKYNLWYKNLKNTTIDSIMDIYDDIVDWEEDLIWLTKWKILNPKTLKDKAIYVLKKEKLPMHFVEIANKISEYFKENVKINTIHNELIKGKDFVLIGRWLYALREWWFKPGTVIDVIVDILTKKWEPMSTEEIIKQVKKVRNVKDTTIYMNLQNKKVIKRVGRNYYDLVK